MKTENQETVNKHHYLTGDQLYRAGEYLAAIAEFEIALKAIPTDFEAAWAIASCYSELGQPDIAEDFYKKALAYCSAQKKDDLIYNIGNSLFDQMKYRDAIQYYERIPKQSQIYSKARKNIKVAQRKRDRY